MKYILDDSEIDYIKRCRAKDVSWKMIALNCGVTLPYLKTRINDLYKIGKFPEKVEPEAKSYHKNTPKVKVKMYKDYNNLSPHKVNLANYKKIQEWGGEIKHYKKKAI